MTEDQLNWLLAAKCSLYLRAVSYVALLEAPGVGDNDMARAENQLCQAAKTFAHVVDSINPKLWEPPSTIIQKSKTP